MTLPRLVLGVVLAVSLAGCGSTVPVRSRALVGPEPATPAAVEAGLVPDQGGAREAPAGDPGGTADTSRPSTTAPVGPASGPVGGATGITSSSAPGVTDSKVYVGIWYAENTGAANAALGANGVDQGDDKTYWDAVLDDLNQAGGVLGRQVVPIYHALDAQSTQTIETQMTAACATWTQDHKVFAVLNAWDNTSRACAQRAGAVALGLNLTGAAPGTYQTYPHAYEPSAVNLVRAGTATVDGLRRQGYFDSRATVGIVTFDDPAYRTAIKDGYLPAFARHGLAVKDVAYLAVAHSAGEVAGTSVDARSAVLRFYAEGIDHVVLVDGPAGAGTGILTLEFVLNAESQRYRPRYGLNSNNGPSPMTGLVPDGAFDRALAVGWSPLFDVGESDDPDAKASPARRHCLAVLKAHGARIDGRVAENTALGACDAVRFFAAALAAGGPLISRDSFVRGVDVAGVRYGSPLTFLARPSVARHDGAVQARDLRYVGGCSCFRYASVPYGIS